jgi:hypothetical protein
MCHSTCCNNTASEHRMMLRLMVDDLVHWARDYKARRGGGGGGGVSSPSSCQGRLLFDLLADSIVLIT